MVTHIPNFFTLEQSRVRTYLVLNVKRNDGESNRPAKLNVKWPLNIRLKGHLYFKHLCFRTRFRASSGSLVLPHFISQKGVD